MPFLETKHRQTEWDLINLVCLLKEIKEFITEESTQTEHGDCFILFALSHGRKGQVFGMDGEPLDIDNDIIRPFEECMALKGKPKIFFFQACQGGESLSVI